MGGGFWPVPHHPTAPPGPALLMCPRGRFLVCLFECNAAAAVAVVAPALVAAHGRGVLFAFYYNAVRCRTLQLGYGGC